MLITKAQGELTTPVKSRHLKTVVYQLCTKNITMNILVIKRTEATYFISCETLGTTRSFRKTSDLSTRWSVNQFAYPTPRQFYSCQLNTTFPSSRVLDKTTQKGVTITKFGGLFKLAVETTHRKILRKLTLRGTSI